MAGGLGMRLGGGGGLGMRLGGGGGLGMRLAGGGGLGMRLYYCDFLETFYNFCLTSQAVS